MSYESILEMSDTVDLSCEDYRFNLTESCMDDSSVSVQEMEEFFKKYSELSKEYDIANSKKAELYKELTGLELRATEYLKALNKEKYVSNYGTFSFRYDNTVLVPKDAESKCSFLSWLKERGIDQDYMTFNSMSINSLFKKEIEATGNPLLEIPGLKKGQPVLKTSFRKV